MTTVSYTPGAVFTKGAMFEVIAHAQPSSVPGLTQQSSLAALEAAQSGWFWEPATGGTLWIKTSNAGSISF